MNDLFSFLFCNVAKYLPWPSGNQCTFDGPVEQSLQKPLPDHRKAMKVLNYLDPGVLFIHSVIDLVV